MVGRMILLQKSEGHLTLAKYSMLQDFTNFIQACNVRQTQSRTEFKEPIKTKHILKRLWEVTETDFFLAKR